jgi:NAD(P)-dependent dehydrogenase (short-subunit alcohol dehydrogenase family)
MHLRCSLAADPKNGAALFVECDLTNHTQLHALVDGTVKEHGRLDCLINNAGWHPLDATIDNFSVQDARNLMELNFFAVFEVRRVGILAGPGPVGSWVGIVPE